MVNTLPTSTESFGMDMLIGNGYYIKPCKIHLSDNLFGFQTKLGWVFGGKTQLKDNEIIDKSHSAVCTTLMPLTKPDLTQL